MICTRMKLKLGQCTDGENEEDPDADDKDLTDLLENCDPNTDVVHTNGKFTLNIIC